MLRLHVVPAQGAPFAHAVLTDALVIGRSSSADLPLADRFLSRHHARLFKSGDRYLVEDLGSRNGTLLNGAPVLSPTAVSPGDVIRISGSTLTVEDAERPSSSVRSALPFDSGHTVFRPVAELLAQESSQPPAETTDRRTLEHHAGRMRLLVDVHRALASALALPELLQLILDRLFEHLRPDQAAIYLNAPEGGLRLAAGRPGGAEARLVHSQHLVREVTEKRLAALVFDVASDERFRSSVSILSAGVRSLLAAPLIADESGPLGMVMLHSNAAVKAFSEEDMELLVSLAAVAAMRIRNVALTEEAAQRRLLEEELALARRIQEGLLPATLPELPGWELHGVNVPSRRVSGDLFQALLRAGGECVLMVADVAGKGVAASLLAASLEALTAGPLAEGLAPAATCERVSRLLFARTPKEKYATAFVAAVDPASGRVAYANAGHNPGLVVRAAGEVERLGPTGVPLGILPVAPYREAAVELAAGDTLVLYTDGITEATGADDEEFGVERLMALCRERREEPPARLAAAIGEAVVAFAGERAGGDDRTLLLLKRQAAG